VAFLAEAISSIGEFKKIELPSETTTGKKDNETLPVVPLGECEYENNGKEEKTNDNKTSCKISSEGGQPQHEDLFLIRGVTNTSYLRTRVGEFYDGSWSVDSDAPRTYGGEYVEYRVPQYDQAYSTYFTVKPLIPLQGLIPAPIYTNQIHIERELIIYPNLQLYWLETSSNETYGISSTKYIYDEEVLRASEPLYSGTLLQIPEALKNRLEPLALEIAGGLTSPYDKLEAIESYLRANYVYDLNYTKAPPGTDPVEWFLFHEKRGVCANFNSAFVLLARSIGLPARLVTGYAVDPDAGYQVVNSKQAHVWAETPFKDVGWITFDATAEGRQCRQCVGGGGQRDGEQGEGECRECDKLFNEDQSNMVDVDVLISSEGGSNSSCQLFYIYGKPYTSYLRSKVGEVYDGLWRPLEYGYRDFDEITFVTPSITGYSGSDTHSFIVEPNATMGGFLPHAQHTTELHLGYPIRYYSEQDTYFTSSIFNTSYQTIYRNYFFEPELLQTAQPIYSEPYLQVPEDLKTRLAPLALNITTSSTTPYDKLKMIESYLRANYVYDLNYTKAPPGTDPVEWFLFHEKRGVCANFNSAFVLLARSIGLPARLVTGYAVDPDSEYQVVMCRNRHTWSEAPFESLGWITFDATAACPSCIKESSSEGYRYKTPTLTEITYLDSPGVKGLTFNVQGRVQDIGDNPIDDLKVIIYLNEVKDQPDLVCGKGSTIDGLFNIACQIPLNMSNGYFNVQANCLGNELYEPSWSDPPIKIITKTVTSFQAPEKVIEGRPFKVSGNITSWKTGISLVDTECRITTPSNIYIFKTGEAGRVNHTLSLDSAGLHQLNLLYTGSEFFLASNNTKNVRVIPLTVSSTVPQTLIRGENFTFMGKVHAEDLPGDNENIYIHLNGTAIASLVTDERGEFSYTFKVHETSKLGNVTVMYQLDSGFKKTYLTKIMARTEILMQTLEYADHQNPFNITTTVTNDLGQPLSQENLIWGIQSLNSSESFTLITNPQGETRKLFNFTKISAPTTLYVNATYKGNKYYLESFNEQTIPISFSQVRAQNTLPWWLETRYLVIGAAILLTAITSAVYYYKIRKRKKKQDTPQEESTQITPVTIQPEISGPNFELSFPQIKPPLPLVWEIDEPLILNIKVNKEDLQDDVTLRCGTDHQEKIEFTDGHASTTIVFREKGIFPIQLFHGLDSKKPQNSVNIKIVEYREEIIYLYKEWFRRNQESISGGRKHTARDFMYFLLEHHQGIDVGRLDKAITLFEIADYSTHDVNREDYETFYTNHQSLGEKPLEE